MATMADGVDPWACMGKFPYDSYALAERKLRRRVSRKGGAKKLFPGQHLAIYRCRMCHHWHFGNAATKD